MEYIYLILLIGYLISIILFTFEFRVKLVYYGFGYLFFFVSLYLEGGNIVSQEDHLALALPAGITAGLTVFFISLFLTTWSLKEVREFGFPCRGIISYFSARPLKMVNIILVCAVEEFIWRAIIQDRFGLTYLGSSHISVIVTAFLFTIIHQKNFKDDFLKKMEFYLFSLFLGYAFFITHSLIFVILVHLIRNINIEYRNSTKKKANSEGSAIPYPLLSGVK